jgi:hypothetical protein
MDCLSTHSFKNERFQFVLAQSQMLQLQKTMVTISYNNFVKSYNWKPDEY